MSDATHYIVATAGHVDHGKSALIKALTGTDPDRLPEEKARGITIDLGFAHLELPSPTSPSSAPRRHRRRAGARRLREEHGGRRRLHRPRAAGRRGRRWVDAADGGASPDPDVLRRPSSGGGADESRSRRGRGRPRYPMSVERLQDSAFADAPIVPTSVVDRTGPRHAEGDAGARAVCGASAPRHRQAAAGRRSGVHAARNRHGGHRNAWPEARCSAASRSSFNRAGKPARIRRIQSHGRDVEASGPGTRTALNLADVDAGRRRASRRCDHAAGDGRRE